MWESTLLEALLAFASAGITGKVKYSFPGINICVLFNLINSLKKKNPQYLYVLFYAMHIPF